MDVARLDGGNTGSQGGLLLEIVVLDKSVT